jgi:hypothetical protein
MREGMSKRRRRREDRFRGLEFESGRDRISGK